MTMLVAAVLLLSSLLSGAWAGENTGGFGCSGFKPDKKEIDTSDMAAFEVKFRAYLPLYLYAAAENDDSAPFTCIVWSAGSGEKVSMTYYSEGTQKDAVVSTSHTKTKDDFSYKFTLPKKGLMGINRDGGEMSYYIIKDSDDFVTVRACENRFLHHVVRTYVFMKGTASRDDYEWRCLIKAINKDQGITTIPKGVCV